MRESHCSDARRWEPATASSWSLFVTVGIVAAGAAALHERSPAFAIAAAAAVAVANAAGAILLRRRRPAELGSLRVLRLLVYVWLGAVGVASLAVASGWLAADKHDERVVVLTVAGTLHAGVLLGATLWPGIVRACFGRLRPVDVALSTCAIALIGLELALVLWGRLWPSPLVWDEASAVARLEAERLPPGTRLFGFPVNSRGYHDEEFFVRRPGDLVACVVADSFGVGVVPYDHNFVTVAERRLADAVGPSFDRVALHNFGVASIGVQQYVHLVDHEVLDLDPDLVVVALFIGNDVLHGGLRNEPRKYSTFQRWAIWRVWTRLLQRKRVMREEPALAEIGRKKITNPPFLADPELEQPHMSEARFLTLERERFDVVRVDRPDVAAKYDRLFVALDYLRDRLPDRLLVLLIPDEFQINDALYRDIVAADPSASQCDRQAPNRRIADYCAQLGVPVLDLLPALREHVRAGGARPYHLRDTHWNAIGNRVAGDALAAWIAAWVRSRSK